jgi:hypothetical protein
MVHIVVVLFCLDPVDCFDEMMYDIPESHCPVDSRLDGTADIYLLPVKPALTSVEREEGKKVK